MSCGMKHIVSISRSWIGAATTIFRSVIFVGRKGYWFAWLIKCQKIVKYAHHMFPELKLVRCLQTDWCAWPKRFTMKKKEKNSKFETFFLFLHFCFIYDLSDNSVIKCQCCKLFSLSLTNWFIVSTLDFNWHDFVFYYFSAHTLIF